MPLQVPQLDDRSFQQLVAEALARIPVHTPEWTSVGPSDPGVTIVELFAFLTENLLYRANRVPEANRRKFLTLLGIPLQPASPGRGLVAFRNDRGPLQPPLSVAEGSEVRAGSVPFRTRTAVDVLPVTASAFVKAPRADLEPEVMATYRQLYETFLDADTDLLTFYQSVPLDPPQPGRPEPLVDLADTESGSIDRSLWLALVGPKNVDVASVRAAIAGTTLTIGVVPSSQSSGRTLPPAPADAVEVVDPGLVFEIAAPEPGPAGTGIGAARYARLAVEYAENVLEAPGIVRVTLPAFDRLLLWDFDPEEEGTGDFPPVVEDRALARRIATWVRVRYTGTTTGTGTGPTGGTAGGAGAAGAQRPGSATSGGKIAWVGVNAARVIQAINVVNEPVGVGAGAPDQRVRVAHTPIVVEGSTPSFTLEVQGPDLQWERWTLTDDLYAAGPSDNVYALDAESGVVSFGDGLRGARPPLNRPLRASYEYGGGVQGQVPIGAISKSPALPGGYKLENPVPTWGAGPGETVADGERNISRYIRHRDRLVTASDFKDLALRTPGVSMGRAEVLPLFNPDAFDPHNPSVAWPGMVTVLVIPSSDHEQPEAPRPDRPFLSAVCAWLGPRRLITTELHARGPVYVPVWVSIGIVPQAGHLREAVERQVKAALTEYLSPLVGGPPSEDADGCEPATDPPSPCPTAPRGRGWPLATEVRRQDLEAVATRVAGVRYVDSVLLGTLDAGGATLTDVERVPMQGLQLPRATVFVTTGPAEDLASLLGGSQPAPATRVPVPVLPEEC